MDRFQKTAAWKNPERTRWFYTLFILDFPNVTIYDVAGGDVMHRTQLILEDKHYEFLKRMSKKENKSISKTLRNILDDYSEKSGLFSLSSIAGIGNDPDASGKDHDKWLYGKK